ncbi:hypothetical protein M427DRAFT_209657 [Gonapodya prolifera JEL478]|uniref:Zn(2)-C6 fungal-type domain-containing protein n=1 Tax=Gonapodya prolifera (strain JEL478) TaxID=1344416 RepID=A0A139ANR9_GONPJ|nr:hypothetical protein M427DRAFT_209657 [Gonapodya prolifera JEL478]|eukprot:KXS18401.1 hypothetical protein M427DRAFT_209657 [Gonapodya prolifera JEL478]
MEAVEGEDKDPHPAINAVQLPSAPDIVGDADASRVRYRVTGRGGKRRSCNECFNQKKTCSNEYPSCQRCQRQRKVCTYPDFVTNTGSHGSNNAPYPLPPSRGADDPPPMEPHLGTQELIDSDDQAAVDQRGKGYHHSTTPQPWSYAPMQIRRDPSTGDGSISSEWSDSGAPYEHPTHDTTYPVNRKASIGGLPPITSMAWPVGSPSGVSKQLPVHPSGGLTSYHFPVPMRMPPPPFPPHMPLDRADGDPSSSTALFRRIERLEGMVWDLSARNERLERTIEVLQNEIRILREAPFQRVPQNTLTSHNPHLEQMHRPPPPMPYTNI